nr:aldehyde dehydrogenase family protein [Fibrobacterota bacterium]
MSQGHFIAGAWRTGKGPEFRSAHPATGAVAYAGAEALPEEVQEAVRAARDVFPAWNALGPEKRGEFLRAFASRLQENLIAMTEAIAAGTGKPLWECRQEVETMIGKVSNSLEAYQDRCAETSFAQAGFTAVKRFRPHGVVAVLGPFNLPGHL